MQFTNMAGIIVICC